MDLMSKFLLAVVLLPVSATAQQNLVSRVENPPTAPVLLVSLSDGPGFTVKNISGHVVKSVRLGCVSPGTTKSANTKVRDNLGSYVLNLAIGASGGERFFSGYSPAQYTCAWQRAAITVLEVKFKGRKRWKLPNQITENYYPPIDGDPTTIR